ncbi:two-component system protein A [Aspergillus udagawae]|uniref:Two-component system protein A n=1 Tax=Aspergillus udagawae TaxID=91492 RepID=A0ABQ1BEG5_9EURO|nr:two-component system protein A [Aspergillus udagawae]GFG19514.1 two-component system protein A [Aspergillus udagawae]
MANSDVISLLETNVTLELHNLTEGAPPSSQDVHFEKPYNALIDVVKDYSILMLDVHGNIAVSNSGASAINRCSPSEIVGEHISIFYGADDRCAGKADELLAACMRDGKWEGETLYYRSDGSRYWANITLRPIYQFGQHASFVKLVQDDTERKTTEARMIAAPS